MTQTISAKAYLVLQPEIGKQYYNDGQITGFKISKLTQTKPSKATPGIVVELALSLPLSAFEPLRPVVHIDVPEGVGEIQIDATVETPHDSN